MPISNIGANPGLIGVLKPLATQQKARASSSDDKNPPGSYEALLRQLRQRLKAIDKRIQEVERSKVPDEVKNHQLRLLNGETMQLRNQINKLIADHVRQLMEQARALR